METFFPTWHEPPSSEVKNELYEEKEKKNSTRIEE